MFEATVTYDDRKNPQNSWTAQWSDLDQSTQRDVIEWMHGAVLTVKNGIATLAKDAGAQLEDGCYEERGCIWMAVSK